MYYVLGVSDSYSMEVYVPPLLIPQCCREKKTNSQSMIGRKGIEKKLGTGGGYNHSSRHQYFHQLPVR
jgi:hypothetical protein